jgi:hypothetical protein
MKIVDRINQDLDQAYDNMRPDENRKRNYTSSEEIAQYASKFFWFTVFVVVVIAAS